ncbi:MAG: PQQ-binding-like beta-propeller repeat protein [Planctomycetaceae bacterium]
MPVNNTRCSYPQIAIVTFALSLLLVSLCTRSSGRADDWPQFRGPNCSGNSVGTAALPLKFSATENVRWTQPVGDGIGSAVAAAGRVFVSGMTAPRQVTLAAFDALSGKPLWKRQWNTGSLPEVHQTNSHASSTPAADEHRVHFYFSTLGLLTLDAATGADLWKQELPVPFFVFKWGAGMSPVLCENLVLFCQDDDLNPALYAFDRVTGQLRWKDDRSDMAVNYSHPIVNVVDGRSEIVVAGTGRLIGYDPQTGHRRWHARTLLRNIKTTPVCRDGVIYLSVQSGGIANQWLVAVDQAETGNRDGRIDRTETQACLGTTPVPEAFFKRTFGRGDKNGDGFLEGRELDLAFLHPDNFAGAEFTSLGDAAAEEFVMAVRGGGTGDVTSSHLLWKHATRHTDHIVSPFLLEDRLLLIKSGGICTTRNLQTGELEDGPRRIGNAGTYFASPVAADGKIFLAAENGTVTVLENSRQFPQLADNDTGDSIIATPSIHRGTLLLRTRTQLLCVAAPAAQ